MTNKKELTSKILEKAREIGFDLVGITSGEPFLKAHSILKERKLSPFTSDDIKLLTTPGLHLAEVKTIIALGLSYASSYKIKEDGYIALYARGDDYHKVFQQKMRQLEEYISSLRPAVKLKSFVDTGAILDREVARRAGLGFIGKNNHLINPEYGSYLLLGEILTDLDLIINKPNDLNCGECQRCLKACPGSALEKEYYLNSERCISYLTQKKGMLPIEERKTIGNNIWGCDTCQQVCPYNQDIPVDLHSEFAPRLQGHFKEILEFTKGEIAKDWQNSALYWRGLRILKRNTLINIANSGKKAFISLVKRQLDNPSPIIRAYAVWALAELEREQAIPILTNILKAEKDNRVINEIKDIMKCH